jgi:hypothetical protein
VGTILGAENFHLTSGGCRVTTAPVEAGLQARLRENSLPVPFSRFFVPRPTIKRSRRPIPCTTSRGISTNKPIAGSETNIAVA